MLVVSGILAGANVKETTRTRVFQLLLKILKL